MPSNTVLIIDDEADLRSLYCTALARKGWITIDAANLAQAKLLLDTHDKLCAVITDMRMPDGTGMDVLHYAKQKYPNLPVTVITAFGDVAGEFGAVEAMRAGAFDYLSKPVDLSVLRERVAQMAAAKAQLKPLHAHKNESAPQQIETEKLVQLLPGSAENMNVIRQQLQRWALTQAPVVIHGESGTGKELAARALHACSPRHQKPFVAVNCGAIPEQLMEAEFFGVRKGAFTGAHIDREGYFQAAHGGTLLLDEVADLPLSMQVKLLRVLQERKVRRVGDTVEEVVDVRIVAASHKQLSAMVQAGKFRQDLYYRLNVMQMTLPALRERGEDVIELSRLFLAKHPQGSHLKLSEDTCGWLRSYTFPGNIRELENILERAIAACTAANQTVISAAHVKGDLPNESITVAVDAPHGDSTPSAANPLAVAASEQELVLPIDLTQHLAQIERKIIEQALLKTRYNRTTAAALLGLNLRQLRYRIEQLGIE